MKRIKPLNGLLAASLVYILSGCAGFQVSAPNPSDFNAVYNGFSQDASGRMVIPVTFTKAVDQSTVVVNQTLFLKFTKNPNAGATLVWSADSKTLTITTVQTRDELMSFNPDDGFCLTLKGSSKIESKGNVVKSKAGVILDGDYNGKPGGDYHMCFFIIG
ncbi:MAG: hypothetical protein WDO19_22435 [Bacteroidota bacterium]